MKIIDKKLIITLALIFILLTISFLNINQSYALLNKPKITSLGKEDKEQNALRVEFESNNSGYDYSYELYNVITNKKNTVAGSSSFYVYQNLKENTNYKIKIRVCSNSNNSYSCSSWASKEGNINQNSNPEPITLDVPNITNLTSKKTNVTLNYTISGNAEGVEIQNITDKQSIKTTNKNTYTFDNLKEGVTYQFKIRSYYESQEKTNYSNWTEVKSITTKTTTVKTPSLTKLKSTKNSVKLTYKTKGNITGVQIQNITLNKSSKKTKKKTTYTWNKLSSNKTYKFKIRAYLTNNSGTFYSSWTSTKSIKTKKQGPTVKEFLNNADKISDYMSSHHYNFSQGSCPTSFSSSKKGKKCTNCAGYVSWVMQETGLLPKGKMFYTSNGKIKSGGSKGSEYLKKSGKFKIKYYNSSVATLVKKGKLKPGDIIGAHKPDGPHTMIYRKKLSNGKYLFASAGSDSIIKRGTTKNSSFSGSYRVGVVIHPKAFDD